MSRGLRLCLYCTLCCLVAAARVRAQVSNTCCYYTVSPGGYAFIANQFVDGDTLGSIFPSVPGSNTAANSGTQFIEWNCQTQSSSTYYYKTSGIGGVGWRSTTSGAINEGTNAFVPGQGAILYNNTSTNYTYTVCGTANSPVLSLTNFCGCGAYNLVSSQTNAPATYEEITGLSPQEGTQLFRYNSGSPFPVQAPNYTVYTYLGGAWTPGVPMANPCESVWIYTPCSNNSPCMVLDCPTNFEVECGTSWSFGTPAVLSNCCTNVTSVSTIVTNGVCPQFITKSWLYTDACGDSSICSQTVTVVSTNPPVITCPSNIVVSSCTNVGVSYSATATDSCCSNTTLVYTPPSGTVFAPGTTNTVQVTATDCCSNSASCSFTVTVVSTNCCVAPPANMSAWWTFDEPSGVGTAQDIAGSVDNFAVYYGNPTAVSGEVNNALCFDGANDYLVVTNQAEVNFVGSCTNGGAESFTIDAWIKPSLTGPPGVQVLLDKRMSSPSTQGYELYLYEGVLGFQIADGVGGSYCGPGAACQNYGSSSPDLRDGQWHFIAVTVARCGTNGNMGTFYIDDQVTSTFLDPRLGDLNSTMDLQIGRLQPVFPPTDGANYAGCLDELEFFKRALAVSELATIYNAGSLGKCRPPCPPSPPAPVINASPTNGVSPLNVNFTLLRAPCGLNIANATVNFGDGNITNIFNPGDPILHIYGPGTWTVTSMTTDSGGNIFTNILPNFITASCSNCCVAPPANMSAWWTFDEPSGVRTAQDIVGSVDNFAVYHGNPTAASGVVSNALCFDGTNDYLVVTNQDEVDFAGSCTNGAESMTIDAWIRPSPNVLGPGYSEILLDKRDANVFDQRGYELYLYQGEFGIQYNAEFDANNFLSGSGNLLDGQWHFIAVTVARCGTNGNMGTFYVDGQVTSTFFDSQSGEMSSAVDLLIGTEQPAYAASDHNPNYMGCLDELEIFKRALSVSELTTIYNAGSFGKCRPPCPPSPPAPVVHATPTNGVSPLNVNFTLLRAPCGLNIANATVNFGDGNITNIFNTGDPILHTYGPGTWTVTAVTTDSGGNTFTNILPNLITVQTPFQAWQLQYFGCINNGSLCTQAAPGADPYGKGISNFNQFLLGLNPTNPASVFRILSLVSQSNNVVITWATGGGPTNVVQATGGYLTNFADISGPIPISGSGDTTNNYLDAGAATNRPSRYYRIRLGP